MTEYPDLELETMPVGERAAYYDEKVRWVVGYAFENAPAMRRKMSEAGIQPSQIHGVEDLERIPITRRDDIVTLQKEFPPFGGLLGMPSEKIPRIFVSPGPIYDALGEEALARTAQVFRAAGFQKGDLVVNTFSYHLVTAGSFFHEALSSLGVRVVPTGVGNTDLQVQIMRDLKVNGYLGTPSFLMTLIRRAEEIGCDFRRDFALKTAFFAAEILPPSLRESFERAYGLRTSQVYGTADMGPLAYECHAQSGLHVPEQILAEIVDPGNGKPVSPGIVGEVVVTAFDRVRPLVRYGTGDLSLYTDDTCTCGRTSRRLVRIVGRIGESTKVRGMFVVPRELDNALSEFPHVCAYQAIVNRVRNRDNITLRIELTSEDANHDELSEQILQKVSSACRVKFDRLEYVAKGAIPANARRIVDERTWE